MKDNQINKFKYWINKDDSHNVEILSISNHINPFIFNYIWEKLNIKNKDQNIISLYDLYKSTDRITFLMLLNFAYYYNTTKQEFLIFDTDFHKKYFEKIIYMLFKDFKNHKFIHNCSDKIRKKIYFKLKKIMKLQDIIDECVNLLIKESIKTNDLNLFIKILMNIKLILDKKIKYINFYDLFNMIFDLYNQDLNIVGREIVNLRKGSVKQYKKLKKKTELINKKLEYKLFIKYLFN